MDLIKAARKIISAFTGSAGDSIAGLKEIILGVFMFNATSSQNLFGQYGVLNNITTLGMAFLVLYGVAKLVVNILWNLLFGKPLEVKVGLIDRLFNRLKVNKAISYAVEDSQSEKQAEQIVVAIQKTQTEFRQKSGRWKRMKEKLKSFFSNLLRNKYTHMATIAVLGIATAFLVQLVNVFISTKPDLITFMSNSQELWTALGVIASPFIVKILRSVGIEDEDQVEIRKKALEVQKANALKDAQVKKVQDARLKAAKNIINKAAEFGTNPVTYANNLGVMPEIVAVIKEEMKKNNTIV